MSPITALGTDMAEEFYIDSMRRRMLPMSLGVASPNDVLTQNVQPGTALPRSMQIRKEISDLESQNDDMSAMQAYGRQQGEAGQSAMLNALAAQFAGERFEPVQAQFLKRAAAAQQPMRVGRGMVTPDGQYIVDPGAKREAHIARLAREAEFADRAEAAQAAQAERIAEARRAEQVRLEDRKEARTQAAELRRELAAGRSQGGQVGSFTPAGFTPQGQQVVTNTKSGVSYLLNILPDGTPNYTPYQGAMIPKATFDKEVSAAGDLSAVAARADALVQAVEANPNAFGLRSAAVSAVPGAMQGYAAKAVGLTPAQLEARSTVLRQAAQEINELYGAALSMGEQARANTFLPNPSDPPEMLISKLKAARDWAKTQMRRYSPAVTNAATQRTGGGTQANSGALTPAELEELARLKAKHRRP